MEPKVLFDGDNITIAADDMLDRMSKEDRMHFISRILFDDEVLEMLLEMVVDNTNPHNGGWHNPDTISDIRDRLLPAMPDIVRTHVHTLRATAQSATRRANDLSKEVYAWRRLAEMLAQWVVSESQQEPRDLSGNSYNIMCRAALRLEGRNRHGTEMERLVAHARAEQRRVSEADVRTN